MSSVIAPTPDRTDRDFDALRQRLIALIETVFPTWDDFSVASFGTILIELFAFVGDVLSYYQDNQARESRLVQAAQRRNVIAHARGLGYTLRGAVAARAELVISLARPPLDDVTIPAGTRVRTSQVSDPVEFEILNAVVIGAGQDPPQVRALAEHSKGHQQVFAGQGLANTEIWLEQVPYLDGSVSVQTLAGTWQEVRSFLSSSSTDLHYVVEVNARDQARVRFGNGRSGVTPTGRITVRYRTGGGVQGNVERGALQRIPGSFFDAQGNAQRVNVTNPDPMVQLGAERESIDEARVRIPEALQTNNRSVTRRDFEIHARQVPGVVRALMLSHAEDRTIEVNTGVLTIVPVDKGEATPALRNQILRQITDVHPMLLTFSVRILSAAYLGIDVATRVSIQAGQSPQGVRERIRTRLNDYLAVVDAQGQINDRVDFGYHLRREVTARHGELAWSDIFNVIRDTSGVYSVESGDAGLLLNGRAENVRVRLAEFPALGSVTVIDARTGQII